MKKLFLLALLAPLTWAQVGTTSPNATSTGTTLYKLAKLTGSPSTAVVTATTDTTGAIGICVSGCGTSGTALLAQDYNTSCVFDGATVAGDYATISSTTAGDCHDAGSSPPSSQNLGFVATTNASGGTYGIFLNIGVSGTAALQFSPGVAISTGWSPTSTPSKSVVQGCHFTTVSTTPYTCTFANPITAGHALYVCVTYLNTTSSSTVTWSGDTGSFTTDPGAGTPINYIEYDTGNTKYASCAYKLSATGGGTGITATNADYFYVDMWAVELSGVTALDASDNGSAQNTNGMTATSNNICASGCSNGDLLIGMSGAPPSPSAGTNVAWSLVSSTVGSTFGAQSFVQPTAGSVNSQMTSSSNSFYWAHITAWK